MARVEEALDLPVSLVRRPRVVREARELVRVVQQVLAQVREVVA